MQHYELSYFVSSKLSDEEIKAFSDKIASLIKSERGESINIKTPTRKKIGYEIKHERQAWFQVANFDLSPEKIGSLNIQIKSMPEIIRSMITVGKPLWETTIESVFKAPRVTAIQKKESDKEEIPSSKEIREEKVELEDIDKKLEEILGEN